MSILETRLQNSFSLDSNEPSEERREQSRFDQSIFVCRQLILLANETLVKYLSVLWHEL